MRVKKKCESRGTAYRLVDPERALQARRCIARLAATKAGVGRRNQRTTSSWGTTFRANNLLDVG